MVYNTETSSECVINTSYEIRELLQMICSSLCYFIRFLTFLEVSYNRFSCIHGQKTHLIIYIVASPLISQCLKQFDKGFSLSKLLLSDWSDGPSSARYTVIRMVVIVSVVQSSQIPHPLQLHVKWVCFDSAENIVFSTCRQLD